MLLAIVVVLAANAPCPVTLPPDPPFVPGIERVVHRRNEVPPC